jgi:hypothetical protein
MPEGVAHSPLRVNLSGLRFFTHYAVSFYLLTPSVVAIYCLATGNYISTAIPGMRVSCFLTLAASGFFAWFQTRALRFRVIKTSADAPANYAKVMEAISRTNWRVSRHNADSQLVATVPGGFPLSFGERVEVRFRGTDVYVNSICDPDKWPQMIAWGNNRGNINYVHHAVTGI